RRGCARSSWPWTPCADPGAPRLPRHGEGGDPVPDRRRDRDMRRVGWLLLMALAACKAGHGGDAVGATDDRAAGGTVGADMPAPDPTAGRDPPADDFAEHDVLPPLDGADLPGFTRERSGADVASTGDEVPILRAVRVGRHDGYDRIVFEFDSDGLPQWSVAYL